MPGKMFRRFMDSVSSSSATFIGDGTEFSGNLKGKGHFVVCGTVEGDCDVDGQVSLALTGRWKGTIKAHDIVIAGKVEGDVFADGKMELAGQAEVKGSLTARSIAIAEGAVVDGDINVTGEANVTRFLEKRSKTSKSASESGS